MPSSSSSADPPPLEVLPWLKTLPLAPEYHPTLAEFRDPIAYILKIEKEASQYGICKIVPPVPAAPKKIVISNFNRSFAAHQHNLSGGSSSNSKKAAPSTFTTRQQQIGFCPRRPRPVQKPVWQSGEQYTLQEFENKARQFERLQQKKAGKGGGGGGGGGGSGRKGGGSGSSGLSPLEIETLFWKACADKPFSVEYANDMPGSGFAPIPVGKKLWEGEAGNVGETAWNMRGVSRANGSLLKFMREEIPGVTSPMVYVSMMFSWFAWHVEDHELHSLNYLHLGAGKSWYGVPRDAALAFEEVIRVHGYGGEVNPLVTFAILGEKTTVMSPEVLTGAGIPCCRLVQNAGEFVVTFPGSYHSGFSLGYNCGEAANIATPGWLRVAKEAAIRRASINYPPMVSHFQLLYELALSFCSRMPICSGAEPRSSRLKDKMKGEGELMVKELFVESVIQNNDLLHILLNKDSSCIVLPQNTFDISWGSNSHVSSQIKVKPRLSLGLCSREEALEASRSLPPSDVMLDKKAGLRHLNGFCSVKGDSLSACGGKKFPTVECRKFENSDLYTSTSDYQNVNIEKDSTFQGDRLLDPGLLSCVTCGILSFACVAVIQPTDAAARYLMSADCTSFNEQFVGYGNTNGIDKITNANASNYDLVVGSGRMGKWDQVGFHDDLHQSNNFGSQVWGRNVDSVSDAEDHNKGISALALLASAYGDSSDSEGEAVQPEQPICTDENGLKHSSKPSIIYQKSGYSNGTVSPPNLHPSDLPSGSYNEVKSPSHTLFTSVSNSGSEGSAENLECAGGPGNVHANVEATCQETREFSVKDVTEPNRLVNTRGISVQSVLIKSTGGSYSAEDSCVELQGHHHPTETLEGHESDGIIKPEFDSVDQTICLDRLGSCSDLKVTPTEDLIQPAQCSNFNASVPVIQRSDKDSYRMHVFCLEHAQEVEEILRPIGGAHVMLLCHPDYPKIEEEARSLAAELGINHIWKDISFKDATKEDRERVRLALEDEETIPVNSDWAVKFGINLYYSANLSKSPLYSKQMPYNTVIYKAFGRSSSGGSPVKLKVYEKRSGRQKKIVVAGKWCGKVWMSNQVHPYLAHRNDSPEKEKDGKSHIHCNDLKDDIKTDAEHIEQVMSIKRNSSSIVTPAGRKFSKRKRSSGKSSVKKFKYTPVDDTSNTVEDLTENSPAQCGRVLRSALTKQTSAPFSDASDKTTGREKLNLKDDTEGGPSTRLRRRPAMDEEIQAKPTAQKQIKKKKAKKTMGNNAGTNDEHEEAEFPCNIEGCTMSFSSKQDLVLHKRNICVVKGCGKKFFSHKYLVQHRRVHVDDRPLKCPWKGCKMSFKWAWARTEHIRVHTGARPYVCKEAGCGQTFRFVSDFSRHKRKTGHISRKSRK